MQKLSVKGLSLALGISWSVCILLTGWASMFGWGSGLVEVMSSIYIGYEAGFVGGLIGAAWGFVDGAVAGLFIALLYNFFSK